MAQIIPCDLHDSPVEADFLLTNIKTGDVLGACAVHLVSFCDELRATLEAMNGGEMLPVRVEYHRDDETWYAAFADGTLRPASDGEITAAYTDDQRALLMADTGGAPDSDDGDPDDATVLDPVAATTDE